MADESTSQDGAANAGIKSDPPSMATKEVTEIGHEIDVWFQNRVKSIEALGPEFINLLHEAKEELKDHLGGLFEKKKPSNAEQE